jgi:hypothetical protein
MSHDVDPQGQCVHMSKGFDPVGWDVVEGRMVEFGARTRAPSRLGVGNGD